MRKKDFLSKTWHALLLVDELFEGEGRSVWW